MKKNDLIKMFCPWDRIKKCLIIMKLISMFLLITVMQVSAKVYSQDGIVKFGANKLTVEQVFDDISSQLGYDIFYSEDKLNVNRKIEFSKKENKVKEVLDKVLDGKFKYKFVENTIIIIPLKFDLQNNGQQSEKVIKGKVTDINGKPLPGVTILIKGTNTGVATDKDGKFIIAANKGDVLVFSFIGMLTKEVVATKRTIEVQLKEDTKELEEVVAIGYGTAKKKDLTGAVTRVSGRTLKNKGYTNITDALVGQAAGVEVLKSGGANGQTKIRIRGDANFKGVNPLIIVDGFPMPSNFSLDDIVLANVKNIDILKGASSSAIYGSKAAGGVIIVTTKRAKKTGKINIDVNLNTKIKELSSKVNNLNIDQLKYVYYRTAFFNSEKLQKPLWRLMNQSQYSNYFTNKGTWKDKNYSWPNELLTNGLSNALSVIVSNRTDVSNYRLSFSYDDINGLIKGDTRKQIRLNGQIGYKLNKYISHNINVGFNKSKSFYGLQYSHLFEMRPDQPFYDENGDPAFVKYEDMGAQDMVDGTPLTRLYSTNNDGFEHSYNISSDLEIRFSKELTFNSRYSVRRRTSHKLQYENRIYSISAKFTNGRLSDALRYSRSISLENTLNYRKRFKKSNINLILGQSYEKNNNYSSSYRLKGFPSDKQHAPWQAGDDISATNVSGYEKSAKGFSLFGRFNYTYNKLSVTSSLRMDQSSRFSQKNNKAFFPSLAASYRLSSLNFWKKNIPFIPYCKIRASIGETGNDFVGEYDWRNLYNSSSYNNMSATYLHKLGNNKLKWEKVEQKDLGINFSLLKGSSINVEICYYSKKTTDILFMNKLPIGTGIDGNMYVNLASVKNKGLELSLRNTILRNQNHNLNINFNINMNRNKVMDINEAFSDFESTELGHYIVTPGQPLGRFYGYVTDGVLKTQEEVDAYNRMNQREVIRDIGIGDYKIVDTDCNGVINQSDRQVLGQSNPDFHGGFNIYYQYKGFSLSSTGKFAVGGERYWKGLDDISYLNTKPRNYLKHILNSYPFDPENAQFPAANFGMDKRLNNRYLIDKYIYDSSYLKINSLTISYDFNRLIKSDMFSTISLNGSINNVYTFTNYPGVNVVSYPDDSISGLSIDYSSYPRERTYSITLKLRF